MWVAEATGAWPRSAADALPFEMNRSAAALPGRRLKVEFVPIQVIYNNEQKQNHPVQDTIRWFRCAKGEK